MNLRSEATKRWAAKYPERARAIRKAAYEKWAAANPDRVRELAAQSRKRNRENRLTYSREWNKRNKARKSYLEMRRYLAKLNRTPAWANQEAIAAVYESARKARDLSGLDYHVDHIIPLRGKFVSGLHVAENLQVIPARTNFRKHNTYYIE